MPLPDASSPRTSEPKLEGMSVIGGTYRERIEDPLTDHVFGSGMRAAGILSSLGHEVQLLTCIDEQTSAEADAVAEALGVKLITTPRDHEVTFRYETPISTAHRQWAASAAPLEVADGVVLGFGMIECDWHAQADTLVVDPQHSPLERILNASNATHVALVLNEHEATRLTGLQDPRAAAHDLLKHDVDVVVIKQGALGGLVATRTHVNTFGAVPTPIVQPLGSGDAFSAGFAHKWATDHDAPLAAAEFASRIAASHSLTGVPQIDPHAVDRLPDALPYAGDSRPRVYLAGPFFSVAERQLVRVARTALRHIGADVFSPLDEIGVGGDEVAKADLDGLKTCTSVLALLDGSDPGTLFEVGWATHAGTPVVAFSENPSDHTWTMLRGTGTTIHNDLSTALYAATWAAIHNQPRPL